MTFRSTSVLAAFGLACLTFQAGVQGASLGKNPAAGLVQGPDGAYYGTTRNGGTYDVGTLFRVDRNGFVSTLVNFSGIGGAAPGKAPLAPLTLATDGKLYGTTSEGGVDTDLGTVFRIDINGVIESLHSFAATNDGRYPKGRVVQAADGNFYLQTSQAVGPPSNTFYPGAVVAVAPNGPEIVLSNFPANGLSGAFPTTGLTQGRNGLFYAVTFGGGSSGLGAIYRMASSGMMTPIYSFTGGNDGSTPQGELVEDPPPSVPTTTRFFYGVTSNGGVNGYGTIYRVDMAAAMPTPTPLVSFNRTTQGANPRAGLTLSSAPNDNSLYGTAFAGGSNGFGTVYRVDRTSGVLTVLHTFTGTDGSGPNGLLVEDSLAPGTFYGTTFAGGNAASGTVFQITSTGQFRLLVDLANPNAAAAPVITSYTSASINPDTFFQYQITATGFPIGFGAFGLPAGLTVNPNTGIISGRVNHPGNFTFTITATNTYGTGTAGFRLIIFPGAPSVTSATTATGQVGSEFNYQIIATNFPTSFEATNLPLGLSYNAADGMITGTPRVPGTFDVILTASNNSGTGSAILHLTILDADAAMNTVQFEPATYASSEAPGNRAVLLTLTATRAGDPLTPISVTYSTRNGTARAGSDYVAVTDTVTFEPRETQKTIAITVLEDNVVEGAENFFVDITNATSARINSAAATAVVTIADNDSGTSTIQFSSDNYSAAEQDGIASLIVIRSGGLGSALIAHYSLTDGSAILGTDYSPTSFTVSFAPQEVSQIVSIPLVNDSIPEANENFRVTLVDVDGSAVIGSPSEAGVTILDDDPQPPPDNATKVLNVSTRGPVQAGDSVMIAGVIIRGEALKQVVLRGRGPSLTELGVVGAIDDPSLTLFDENGAQLAFNDDYGTNSAAARSVLTSNGLTPSDAREAAIVTTLAPTNYTLILRGKTNGIGLVEVYDIDRTAASRFANISTRGKVEQDDNGAMIAGFIIAAPADQPGVAQRVVIRANGPSLTSAGINNALADTTLDLYRGSQLILSNDNWKNNTQADRNEFSAYGLTPANDKEAALVTSLDPGSYSAVVRGKNNTTGVALVEVYQVNP